MFVFLGSEHIHTESKKYAQLRNLTKPFNAFPPIPYPLPFLALLSPERNPSYTVQILLMQKHSPLGTLSFPGGECWGNKNPMQSTVSLIVSQRKRYRSFFRRSFSCQENRIYRRQSRICQVGACRVPLLAATL